MGELGQRETLRVGPWNGVGFQGAPVDTMNPIFSIEFVVNQKEIYYRYKLKSPTTVQRLILVWDRMPQQLQWIKRTQEWVVYGNIIVDACSRYVQCGPFGRCSIKSSVPCSCLEGFEPKVSEEWKAGDWSSGCQPKKSLDCRTPDVFHKISGVIFPDTRHSKYNLIMTHGECEMACRRDCNCTDLDIRNEESGCFLWFNELMDIREYDDHQELYIRMATSELAAKGQFSFNKNKGQLAVLLSVSSTALFLYAVAYACKKKMKRIHKRGRGSRAHTLDTDHTSVQMENLDELAFFNLHKIDKATNNFNIDNKIGEGDFGPVYKGVLENGQVITVKRLSETSQQGLDEF
ncbi:G-type lectin S-receptor-like serine/threonine-protein kinase At4g27290 [Lactuca sativa]|uniref:G-type lectin S-receptor-like serine/threonine-protein kinase At4g27290 n=1 Tax=Lactuca sativa TaxID=4236 RepID=UPI0022AE9A3B|nr:G-type lectin S-receptor-like serine/threonine-protein kinase At4g27290 [Lactuca sativa]